MAVKLDKVVPFGRSFDEYVRMFSLSETELYPLSETELYPLSDFAQKSILSVADGPASFNAEGTEYGCKIQSVDPLYAFSGDDIRDRFYAVCDNIIEQVRLTPDDWVWRYHRSPDDLKVRRSRVTERFYQDYDLGKQQGRYTLGELPTLPYADGAYDLGLCSHFLFLYSQQFNRAFHLAAVLEMLRVCKEVRIFPLLGLDLVRSPHLPFVIQQLEQSGYACCIQTVDYELQKGGNEMLKITPSHLP
ncbi:MAG: SAM-dependent methyltransferase [Phormidesmis sp. RL_2_1]|nr:SAM-dependent methyltransferase [Phormidesmis sp. RL_2_1]